MGSAALAAGAEMGAPPGDPDALDEGPAARARLPLPAVHSEPVLEQAFEPIAVPEVADSRPLERDRFIEHGLNGGLEPLHPPAPKADTSTRGSMPDANRISSA